MKAIVRSHFWWPGLDKDLEKLARSCLSCQTEKQAPAKAPLWWSSNGRRPFTKH